jgi:hypothetical protein
LLGVFYYFYEHSNKTKNTITQQTGTTNTSFLHAIFHAPPNEIPALGIPLRNGKFANTLTTEKRSAVENTPFIRATTRLHCRQVACLLPELSTKGLPDNPADGRSI